MKRETKKTKKTNTVSTMVYLKIFVVVFVVLVIASLAFKFIKMITDSRLKLSTYTVLIVNSDAYLMQVKNSTHEESILKISRYGQTAKSQSRLSNSIAFGIPIDGEIFDEANVFNGDPQALFNFSNLISVFLGGRSLKFTNMNEVDFAKIYTNIGSVTQKNSDSQTLPDFNDAYIKNKDKTNNLVYQMFKSQDILNDITSVEIINATEVDGAGAKVAQMLKNAGYNVLAVSSSDKPDKSKIVIRVDNPLLEKRFKLLFNMPIEKMKEQHIADVTIVLGRDLAQEIERIPN